MTKHLVAITAALLFASGTPLQAQQAAPATPPAAAAPAPAPAAAPAATSAEVADGKLAYYGNRFAGRKTASGERFNPRALTMAHKTLPFGTLVRVTNPTDKRSVVVRVNDRGPSAPDRVGDLSLAAARQLRMTRAGVIEAKLEVVGTAKRKKA